MVLLSKPAPGYPLAATVLVVRLHSHIRWVRLTEGQHSLFNRGYEWGVVDTANGCALSLHTSQKAAAREARYYNKVDHAITKQLSR
jgi:hypothetical protein